MLRTATALAAMLYLAAPAFAGSDPDCRTLYAGQHIDVGTVCVDNDDETLTVTYATTGGWTLHDLHLAVGASFDDIPTNQPGNPRPGHFPHKADAEGATEYTFEIPLGPDGCDVTYAIAAHAVVQGDGQRETAWGDGERFRERGNWATWFEYHAPCDKAPAPDKPKECPAGVQTAFAYGDTTLNSLGLDQWGWQITVHDGDTHQHRWLYVDVEDNMPTTDDIIGRILYTYAHGELNVTIEMAAGWRILRSFVYADAQEVWTVDPKKYTFRHKHGAETQSHFSWDYDEEVDGDLLYMVVRVDICPH